MLSAKKDVHSLLVLFLLKKYEFGERKVSNIIEGGDKMETNLREFYKNSYLYDRIPYIHEFTPSGKVSGTIFAISTIEIAIPILHGSSGCGFHYKYF